MIRGDLRSICGRRVREGVKQGTLVAQGLISSSAKHTRDTQADCCRRTAQVPCFSALRQDAILTRMCHSPLGAPSARARGAPRSAMTPRGSGVGVGKGRSQPGGGSSETRGVTPIPSCTVQLKEVGNPTHDACIVKDDHLNVRELCQPRGQLAGAASLGLRSAAYLMTAT